jgi:hypothetical protein
MRLLGRARFDLVRGELHYGAEGGFLRNLGRGYEGRLYIRGFFTTYNAALAWYSFTCRPTLFLHFSPALLGRYAAENNRSASDCISSR